MNRLLQLTRLLGGGRTTLGDPQPPLRRTHTAGQGRVRRAGVQTEENTDLQVVKTGNTLADGSGGDGPGYHVDQVVISCSAHYKRHIGADSAARVKGGLQAKRSQRELVHGVAAAAVVGANLWRGILNTEYSGCSTRTDR